MFEGFPGPRKEKPGKVTAARSFVGGCEPVQSGRKRSPGVRVSVHCVITVGAVRSRRGVNARVDQDGGDGVNECVRV